MVFYHSVAYQNGDVYYYGYVGGEIPQLQVELTPIGAPIQIPPGGGSFHYDISITNIDTFTGAFDAWIDAVLPNGSIYGPIILRNNLSLAPGQTIIRTNLTQNVPASAPAGEYYYRASAGDYPATIVASDSFSFDKLAGEDGSYSVGGWELYGWEGEAQSELSMPMDYMMLSAFPNPFNSTTTLQIELPQRSNVKLELYNINGQLIRVIYSGMQNAGSPKFRFDASDLASGVYFCKMKAESLESSKKFSEVNKLILLK
jgi:hypothetical protein